MSENGHIGPIQRKMLAILADGMPHRKQELFACLSVSDDQIPWSNIRRHMTPLRKHLRPKGHDIICMLIDGSWQYRLVRLLASPYDGRS